MKRSDLTEFAIEEEGFKLKICRGADGTPTLSNGRMVTTPPILAETSQPSTGAVSTATMPPMVPASISGASPVSSQDELGVTYIKSPMVGTFYRAASPEGPPFIEIGAKVEEKTVVCIIEAMKIMNEIQAETKGAIVEALVENGQPVEYGQRLFKVKVG